MTVTNNTNNTVADTKKRKLGQAEAQDQKDQKAADEGGWRIESAHILVADAREPSEPELYLIDTDGMPNHMQRALKRARRRGHTNFPFVNFVEGAEGTGGLVNEDYEGEERVEEVEAWLDRKCNRESSKFQAPASDLTIDFTITLAYV